ncbi:MAG: WD40 repeat domain-containing protein, partial [Acidobacteriota bacterium]|nr:WD40 repeat domain-containing protein [Acidobacteriota bacterium]
SEHPRGVHTCRFSPGGRRIVSHGTNETDLRVWDGSDAGEIGSLECGADPGVFSFSGDGRVVAGTSNGMVVVLDLETCKQVNILKGHEYSVTTCAYTPDDSRIVSGELLREIKVWDAQSGQERGALKYSSQIESLACSPDGRRAACLYLAGDVVVWDIPTSRIVTEIKARGTAPLKLCLYSPDGRVIPAATHWQEQCSLKIWDAETGEVLKVFGDVNKSLTSYSFSPDGRQIATAIDEYENSPIMLWDAGSSSLLKVLEAHTGAVKLAYSPDAWWIFSASKDRTIRIWSIRSGEQVACFYTRSESGPFDLYGDGEHIIAGDLGGWLYLLRAVNLPLRPAVVTATRLYRHALDDWDSDITTSCGWCGRRFTTTSAMLDTLHGIVRDVALPANDAPCLSWPTEAWDDPRLLSECPHCHQLVRFNPFIVDNRDRY